MRRECSKSKTPGLIRMLKRIHDGEDLRLLAKEISEIARDIGPDEMEDAQEHLQRDGYTDAATAKLLAAFVLTGVYEQKRNRSSGLLPHTHILEMVNAEHVMFRALASELVRILEDISALEDLSDTSLEFRRLAHTVHHLRAMNEHFDREEDVIFPCLDRRGWPGLCQQVAEDHVQLRAYIDHLAGLVQAVDDMRLEDFKSQLAAATTGLCRCLFEHLSFEDGLVWPLALVIIDDPRTWHIIRAACDEIGYCGIHA